MSNKTEKWCGEYRTEYSSMSPEERREIIDHHVKCIDKVVGDAMRKEITNYLNTVFIRLWGSDLEFVAQVLDAYQERVENDKEFAHRHLDPRSFFSPVI